MTDLTPKAAALATVAVTAAVGLITFVILDMGTSVPTVVQTPAAQSSSSVPSAASPSVSYSSLAAPVPAETDPWAIVAAYYGDIESGDYPEAWNLMSVSFQDALGGGDAGNYQGWVDGYADTGTEDLTDEGESGGTVNVNLAAYDTATGTWQYFTGSYTVINGLIVSGTLVPA